VEARAASRDILVASFDRETLDTRAGTVRMLLTLLNADGDSADRRCDDSRKRDEHGQCARDDCHTEGERDGFAVSIMSSSG